MEPPVIALYDANILYPAPLRDLCIREELLSTLESQELTQAVARLRQFIDLL